MERDTIPTCIWLGAVKGLDWGHCWRGCLEGEPRDRGAGGRVVTRPPLCWWAVRRPVHGSDDDTSFAPADG